MPLPKSYKICKKAMINVQRRVSELVNLSGIVPCAKGQISMQNNQLSHTRWDRDQLFRNCFSNPFQRPRKARSAKWKHCAQCSWLERKSACVQNKWKPKRGFSDKLTDDHIWRFVTFFLCEKHQRFVVRPNEAWRKETLLPSVSVKHYNKRNPAKARRGLQRNKQQANENWNAQTGWKPCFLSKRG